MLTPQEAESHVFPKASFGGYNMLQVDNFLDSLIEDYRTLYQEPMPYIGKTPPLRLYGSEGFAAPQPIPKDSE